ncbi:ankyrin repeat domain-containing protein 22 isoform X2 [Scleropages formosus]|uniref:ankyrin repeat domain-containing protein 22 isoform X2 n=1 Tax=Scleropages formosus TaxID=113540 RepID=UPI0008790A9D|nr:ankyrin repeat domain-containing protein 22 isoform X2 [Scleropages formosus]
MGILYSEPICQAAYDDDLHQVVRLVKTDARNLNVQDELFGDTPIIAACRRGNVQTVTYLLQQNADVSIRNKVEKTKRNANLMKLILNSNVEINAVDCKGNTALHYACQRKSDHLVSLLLDKNADISITNADNETPLDIARRLKFKNIVTILKKSD